MVVLTNKARRPLVYNLDHDVVCAGDDCVCSVVQQTALIYNADGVQGRRTADKRICASVHLAPGCSSEPLPDSVLSVAAIAAGEARGEIVVKELT